MPRRKRRTLERRPVVLRPISIWSTQLTQEISMLARKSIFALAAIATLGTTALAPTSASAFGGHFGGGHVGGGHFGGGHFGGGGRHFSAGRAISRSAGRAGFSGSRSSAGRNAG